MGQKRLKVLMDVCKSQVACDGTDVMPGKICYKCQNRLEKRAAAAAFAKSIERQLLGLE